MSAYTDWFDYVLPDVPGVANRLATQKIREAVIEFCRRTLLYKHNPAAINIVGGTAAYTVTPPAGTVVSDFTHVLVNGKQVDPQTPAWLDQNVTNWRTTATGPARAYLVTMSGQIKLVPTPPDSIASGLVVEVALRPTVASTTCPDWLLEDFQEAISHGAKGRLFAMKRKPWTDAQLARFHMAEFNSWCGVGGARASQSRTRVPLHTSVTY